MFIGFAACFPRVLPRWLYTRLFCPPQPRRKGTLDMAPCGLRKIESALVRSGLSGGRIAVAHPDNLGRAIGPETKVIGINTSDPLGLGPASSTFSSLLRKEPYTAYFFRQLLNEPAVRRSNAKIIVGGPGVWQLANESARRELGIDCVVEGEGELIAPQLFKDAIAGKPLPDYVSGGPVPVEDIPMISGPTVNGTVEISRGCGRGCEFCNPNMRLVRHIPLEHILGEVRLNLAYSTKITLHAEDVLRYKAMGMQPNRAEVVNLFERTLELTDNVGMSHIALSSALADPKLIDEISNAYGATDGKRCLYAQTGVETGSPDLVNKHMRGKAKPFQPDKWPEVVRESFKLLADSNWVVCGTLVMGMPGERPEDVAKTLELVRDLRQHKCLLVPLFFVPLGELREDEFFTPDAMLPEHWMLLAECMEHDFHWVGRLMDELFSHNRMSSARSGLFKVAAWYMERRLRESMELMKEGKDPRALLEPLEDHENQPAGTGMGEA
jgi:radical SAM superfamily enzyme YgiQ (UPF0313 family)